MSLYRTEIQIKIRKDKKMKKVTAVIMAGTIAALCLSGCSKEPDMQNYSIEQEAEYYYEKTGEDTQIKLVTAIHPSLQCSALTMPTVSDITLSDNWYLDGGAKDVELSLYKTMTVNDSYGTDTELLLTFTGASGDISTGLNKDTFDAYLTRYFSSSDRKKIGKFIEKSVNTAAAEGENSKTYEIGYRVGGIQCEYNNDGEQWSITIDAYYNNEISSGDYIDKELAQKIEPYVGEAAISDFIGSNDLVVDYNNVISADYLKDKMGDVGYTPANSIYQHDENVTVDVDENGKTAAYYISIAFKPKSGDGANAAIKQSYTLDYENNEVNYRLEGVDGGVSDDKLKMIICSLTELIGSDVDAMLKSRGTEIKIDDKTTASMDNDRALTINIKLS